ncbi:hypothetical protein EGW08_007932, partial [Elysia chlorotica]
MGFAMQFIKQLLNLRRILKELAQHKENRIREIVGLPPVESWWSQFKGAVCGSIRACMCRIFCPCCIELPTLGEFCCPEGSFTFRLCTPGQYMHEVIKSFFCFVCGLLLSMGIFFFFSFQLEVNLELALAIAIFSGLFLSIGLAFFNTIRCLVLISFPNFASSKGRSFIIMYAMVLILNHPVQDFSHNLEVLTDAATCGQSLALNETKKLAEAAAAPLVSIISGIKVMLKGIRRLADALRKAFKALQRAVEEIISIIGKVFKWLAGMTDVCNKNMGNPFRKCKKVFQDGYNRCRRKLWIFKFLCSVVRLVKKVCYIARIGELLCMVVDVIKKLILKKVARPIVTKIQDVREMFYFNVSVNYRYVYTMNQSRPYSEIRQAILDEVAAKLSIVHVVQTILDNTMCFTVLLVVVKAVLYRRKFLKKDGFDNFYVTKRLYEVEARRLEMGKDGIFPLRLMETFRFLPTFSYFMTKNEITKLIKGLLFWLFGVFHATYYIICDYSLYWVLDLVRRHFDYTSNTGIPPHLQLHVQGQGPMADMYRSMIGVVEPAADDGLSIDTRTCLPNPKEPNYAVYKQVTIIYAVTFFLTIFEAYLLRMRHIVTNMYYPHRDKARAVWLYNHIKLTRDSFLIFTRKQVARKYKNEKAIEKHSFLSRLAAGSKLFRALLRCVGRERKYCLSCGLEGAKDDVRRFTHCINCKSPYCNDCFQDLKNICTACMNPVDYGDIDGVSVEEDSSEDEQEKKARVKFLEDRKQKLEKKREEFNPKKMLSSFHKRLGLVEEEEQSPTAAADAEELEGFLRSMEDGASGGEDGASTSSYDTDYQHESGQSCSEGDESCSLANPKKRKRLDRVTVDIFPTDDEDGDKESGAGDDDDDDDDCGADTDDVDDDEDDSDDDDADGD